MTHSKKYTPLCPTSFYTRFDLLDVMPSIQILATQVGNHGSQICQQLVWHAGDINRIKVEAHFDGRMPLKFLFIYK